MSEEALNIEAMSVMEFFANEEAWRANTSSHFEEKPREFPCYCFYIPYHCEEDAPVYLYRDDLAKMTQAFTDPYLEAE